MKKLFKFLKDSKIFNFIYTIIFGKKNEKFYFPVPVLPLESTNIIPFNFKVGLMDVCKSKCYCFYNKFYYLIDFKFFFGFSFNFYLFMKKLFFERIQKHLTSLGFNSEELNFILCTLKNSSNFLYRISNGNPFSVLGFLFLFSHCLIYIKLCEFVINKKFILKLISFLVDLEFSFWWHRNEYSLNEISNFFFLHFPKFFNSLSLVNRNFFYSFFLNLVYIDPVTKAPCRVFFRGEFSSFIQFSFIYLFNNSFSSFLGFSYFFSFNEISKFGIIVLDPKIYTSYMDLGFLSRSGLYLEINSLFFLSISDLSRFFYSIFYFSTRMSSTIFPSFDRDCFFSITGINVYIYGVFLFNNGLKIRGYFKNKSCYFFHSKEGGVNFDFYSEDILNQAINIQKSKESYFFSNPLTGESKSKNDCIFQNCFKNYLSDPILPFDGESFHIYVYFKYLGHSRFSYSYFFKKGVLFIKVHKGLVFGPVSYLNLSNNFLSLEGSKSLVSFESSSVLLENNILELEEFYGIQVNMNVFRNLNLVSKVLINKRNVDCGINTKGLDGGLKDGEVKEILSRYSFFFRDRGLKFYSQKNFVSGLDIYNFKVEEFFSLLKLECGKNRKFNKWVREEKKSLGGILKFGEKFDFNFGKVVLEYLACRKFYKYEYKIFKHIFKSRELENEDF